MGTLWLHMDKQYLWRWFCTDENGNTVAQSGQAYFKLADASAAMQSFSQSFLKPLI